MPRKKKFRGRRARDYGLRKEKEALSTIRNRFPTTSYIIEHRPASRGAADYKVFNKLSDGSKGACVAVIQVKTSKSVGGARHTSKDIERLRKSAAAHGGRCVALFLLIERDHAEWVQV